MNPIIKSAARLLKTNSSKILIGAGIAGMITAVVTAVEDTPKAIECIENAKKEKGEELTKTEIMKASWKCYIRTAIFTGVSATCIIVGTVQQSRQHAALMAAYSLLESSSRDYHNKVIEMVGKDKDDEIQEAVSKDKAKKISTKNTEYVIETGKGDDLMMDYCTNRLFYGNAQEIKRLLVDANYQLYNEDWISLNEIYYMIGLNGIPLGNAVGWRVEHGPVEPKFVAGLTDDDKPCVVLSFKEMPSYFG
jgi:tRNA(Ser,Leu) C12 N-acetylase TAN1